MTIFIILFVIAISVIYAVTNDKSNTKSTSFDINNISKTEMMADMYKDISGKKLDEVEKSILLMNNMKKKK